MDLRNENNSRLDVKRIGQYSSSKYTSGSRNNINFNEFSLNPTKHSYDSEQSADALKIKKNEEDLRNNISKLKGKLKMSPHFYNNKLRADIVEPRETRHSSSQVSSHSICSQYLLKDIKYSSDITGHRILKNKVISQSEYNIQQQFNINSKRIQENASKLIGDEQTQRRTLNNPYSDKTTYCRPAVNIYNQELLYKTLEKNAKLRRLVSKLVIARQKEKNMEKWNNFINDLKRKHCEDNKVKRATSLGNINEEFETLDIEDLYNITCTCKESVPCHYLLQNVYKPHDIRSAYYNQYYKTPYEYARIPRDYNTFKMNPLCYPTCSQGRLLMLEKEKMKRFAAPHYKPFYTTIDEEIIPETRGLNICNSTAFESAKQTVIHNNQSTNKVLLCTSTQTEFLVTPPIINDRTISKGCNTNHNKNEKEFNMEPQDTLPVQKNVDFIYNNFKKSSLVHIEEKLDNLIYCLNNFIIEMKSKNLQTKYFDQHNETNINHTRSESCRMARGENVLCGLINTSSRNTRNSSIDNIKKFQTIDNLTRINDIIFSDIGQNKLITLKASSVPETNQPCSVQISVTIPTREISTEVTRSLSKAGNATWNSVIKEKLREETTGEIPTEDRRIAIAVNTDPFNLLAMLKATTEETMKRLLSYLPAIDYYSYLTRLHGPPHKVVESQYICNICGAAFRKPSILSDHIQKHELGNTRDCCVCRHVLDLPRRRQCLFKCQYCGQRFTRAYCCELHQEECAKLVGKLHDVTSSLVMLR